MLSIITSSQSSGKMFDILFGWRKASKCKKLVKAVQCRLKLLKSKRRCIVKLLREDVSELVRNGHYHTAFGRVEQIIMDQNMVEAYDLLDQYCEFVIISMPYIRKHMDLPNDVNEAVSTLIFSSSRFGELPELLSVRKVFGERYGKRYVRTAVDLLPGNLVNHQIKETANMRTVPDDVKYRLLDEIASNCFREGPLLLEYYKPELQSEQEENKGSTQAPHNEIETHKGREMQRRILYTDDLSHEDNKLPNEMDGFTVSQTNGIREDSSSDTSSKLTPEKVYRNNIEEFVSPVSKKGNLQDQRLFVFPFPTHLKDKSDYGTFSISHEKGKPASISSLKKRKASRKMSKKRSVSRERRNVTVLDIECAIYYGYSKRRDRLKQEHTCYLNSCCMPRTKSSKVNDLEARKRTSTPGSRAITMPVERNKQSLTDSIFRSNSFPFEESQTEHSSFRHIHPKLPDYDELAAKFMELKRETLQNKRLTG